MKFLLKRRFPTPPPSSLPFGARIYKQNPSKSEVESAISFPPTLHCSQGVTTCCFSMLTVILGYLLRSPIATNSQLLRQHAKFCNHHALASPRIASSACRTTTCTSTSNLSTTIWVDEMKGQKLTRTSVYPLLSSRVSKILRVLSSDRETSWTSRRESTPRTRFAE